jgi:hypothetical protein
MFVAWRLEDVIRAADAGLAIDPNAAVLFLARGCAENYLGRYEKGESDLIQGRRLSPHESIGYWCRY